jgi:hypothetical protein
MSVIAALLLGVAWPREWIGRCSTKLSLRGLGLSVALALALLPVAIALAG